MVEELLEDDLAPDADEPGDAAPEDLEVESSDHIMPDNVDQDDAANQNKTS